MANRLPQQVREKIICIVYRKADEFAYMECDRVKNGQFMDILVEDPDVGGVLRQYMQKNVYAPISRTRSLIVTQKMRRARRCLQKLPSKPYKRSMAKT